MSKLARDKGASFEREIARLLRSHGWTAERRSQYRGGKVEGSDVTARACGLRFAVECKHRKRVDALGAYEQAARDAADDEQPLAIVRRHGSPHTLAVLDAVLLARLLGALNLLAQQLGEHSDQLVKGLQLLCLGSDEASIANSDEQDQ